MRDPVVTMSPDASPSADFCAAMGGAGAGAGGGGGGGGGAGGGGGGAATSCAAGASSALASASFATTGGGVGFRSAAPETDSSLALGCAGSGGAAVAACTSVVSRIAGGAADREAAGEDGSFGGLSAPFWIAIHVAGTPIPAISASDMPIANCGCRLRAHQPPVAAGRIGRAGSGSPSNFRSAVAIAASRLSGRGGGGLGSDNGSSGGIGTLHSGNPPSVEGRRRTSATAPLPYSSSRAIVLALFAARTSWTNSWR